MKRYSGSTALAIIGFFIFLTSVVLLYSGDVLLTSGRRIAFESPEGEVLAGTYYPGTLDAGVLLVEGFGSDQTTLRSLAIELSRVGLHVMTFDFSGHGRSPGGLTFDNAAKDRLAKEVQVASLALEKYSGLDIKRIFWVGHSLGARSILQAATIGHVPKGLVLIGAQVNLTANTQAEFFTGTVDNDLDWVRGLSPQNPPTNVLMLSGAWDDILTPQAATLLIGQLSGDQKAISWQKYPGQCAECGREWDLFPNMVHNYEVDAPEVITRTVQQIGSWIGNNNIILQANNGSVGANPNSRIAGWMMGMIGLIVMLVGVRGWSSQIYPGLDNMLGVRIVDLKKFLLGKLMLWLAALIFIALVGGFIWLLPLHTPVFNLYYVAFIGGYGLLMLLLYSVGQMPWVSGRLKWHHPRLAGRNLSTWLGAIGFNVILFLMVSSFANSGWFFVPPLGERFVWVLIFTPIAAVGFFFGALENDLILRVALGRRLPQFLATLIGLLPFFIWNAAMAVLGSISGLLGGLQGIFILIIVLLQGGITVRLTGQRWMAALLQALLLFFLVLPQGVLFLK